MRLRKKTSGHLRSRYGKILIKSQLYLHARDRRPDECPGLSKQSPLETLVKRESWRDNREAEYWELSSNLVVGGGTLAQGRGYICTGVAAFRSLERQEAED